MIKAVLFDMDGVLVSAVEIHKLSFNMALQDVCGFELTDEEHLGYFNGLPTKKKIEKLMEQDRVNPAQIQDIFNKKQNYTIDAINNECKLDFIKQDLHIYLKAWGLKLACVTNSIRKTTELMLDKTGQLQYLDLIVTNEDVSKPKPNPEGYLKAMEYFGAKPEEVLICEDSPHGIQAAQDSGGIVIQVSGPEEVDIALFKKYLKDRL